MSDTIDTMPRRSRLGRPPRDPSSAADLVMAIRVTSTERAKYEQRAAAAGLSLSEWVRSVCDVAARADGGARSSTKARR